MMYKCLRMFHIISHKNTHILHKFILLPSIHTNLHMLYTSLHMPETSLHIVYTRFSYFNTNFTYVLH